jgi:glycosyltransferase involved in cell wall biosynthesis
VNPSIDKERLLIMVPVWNEAGRIGPLVSTLQARGFPWILVVDDGSEDQSGEEASAAGAKVLYHWVNRGVGAATETGLTYFREKGLWDCLVTIDGDQQHSAEDIEQLVCAHLGHKADLTVGDRFMNGTNEIPTIRIFYNAVADGITTLMSGKRVRDSQSGFKVWSKKAVELIKIEQNGYEFCSEVLIKAHHFGLRVHNQPIQVYYPEEIKDKGQNFYKGVKTFANLMHHFLFKS